MKSVALCRMYAFPCATLQDGDTGRIAIYYGCADSYVGLAFTDAETVIEYIQSHDAANEDDRSEGRKIRQHRTKPA